MDILRATNIISCVVFVRKMFVLRSHKFDVRSG